MHLTAARDGSVWGLAHGQHPADVAVANESGIVGIMDLHDAMSEVRMACGGRLTSLQRLTVEAMLCGNDALA